MKPKILAYGEVIWDIYDEKAVIGGAGLNFAAHAKKCGADSYIYSAIGQDVLGGKAKKEISGFGVKAEFLQESDKMSGQCVVKLNSKGVPTFNVLEDVAYDNIKLAEKDIKKINELEFDALYFGTLIQRSNVSRSSLRKLCSECSFGEIVCDINLRKNCYDVESVRFCFENATIIKISDEEEPLLRDYDLYKTVDDSAENICKAISDSYPHIKYIIFTCGEKGSMIFDANSKKGAVYEAKPARVVSTVGAGDSFIAGWISSYLMGKSIEKATKIATELAGFVVSNQDAIPDYKLEGEVIKEMKNIVLFDMHVHSQNSHDSNAPILDTAKECFEKGMSGFAVTDHCDIQYYVDRDMPGAIKGSMEEIESAAEIYKDKLDIFKGIEIGEGIWNVDFTKDILAQHDYDVVIGSVHAVRYKDYTNPYSTIDFEKFTDTQIDEYLDLYFDEVLEMLHSVPCDIMAHLTCPVSYINGVYKKNADVTKYKDKICKILRYIIDNNIAMEINTSRFSANYGKLMPDEWIISEFKEMGGWIVTLGSDAHIPENAGKNLHNAIEVLKKNGFDGYYYYKGRKHIKCDI